MRKITDEKTLRALGLIGGLTTSASVTLQFLDLNNTGLDDQIARFARHAGVGFSRAASGIAGAGDSLRIAAQIINDIADEVDGKQQQN